MIRRQCSQTTRCVHGLITSFHRVQRRTIAEDSRVFRISEEVREALISHRPVIALETTIYTHGWPSPSNLELARHLESLVRSHGAVPATIGVLNGVAHVGFTPRDLEELVTSSKSSQTLKLSRRDLAFALGSRNAYGKRFDGGTTVAGTMVLAHMAGIKIFATGGLGGVHRGADMTMDVSADLTELGRTPVAVVSSGCKAFLDLPMTLEYLETQGVAVGTFADGREVSVDFPAFWTRESGLTSPRTIQDEQEAAEIVYAHHLLGLKSGLHLANPIPEEHSLPKETMNAAIDEALQHANHAGATGAAATPFILRKIKEVTGEKSLVANRALVEANVIRGTKVAVALQKLEAEQGSRKDDGTTVQIVGPGAANYTVEGVSKGVPYSPTTPSPPTHARGQAHPTSVGEPSANVFVAGSLALDFSCDYITPEHGTLSGDKVFQPAMHTSNPAHITPSLGGVGGNVARAAHLIGADVQLCSVVGDDLSGKAALEALNTAGLSTSGVQTLPTESGSRTAQYIALNDTNKDLVVGMADMAILESTSTGPETISSTFDALWLPNLLASNPSHLIVDANWPPAHLSRWLQAGKQIGAHISYEPVSTAKSTRLFSLPTTTQPNSQNQSPTLPIFPNTLIDLATPNTHELLSLYNHAREHNHFDRPDWFRVIDAFGIPHSGARVQLSLATTPELVDQGVPQQCLQLLPFIPTICAKLGAQGVLVTQILPAGDERLMSGEYAPYILSRCGNGSEEGVGVGGVYMRLFPVKEGVPKEEVVSVNGVGDTFLGALVAGMAKRGAAAKVEEFVDVAQMAAGLTLRSRESVAPGVGDLKLLV